MAAHGVGHAQEFLGGGAPSGYPAPHGATSPFGGPPHGAPSPYGAPPHGAPSPYGAPHGSPFAGGHNREMPGAGAHGAPAAPGFGAPPTPSHQGTPPPSGFRVPLSVGQPFPQAQAGPPVAQDADGSPVFIGSAILGGSVHPCKIVPTLNPPVRVPYGGGEYAHNGRYDLLPFDPATMEWVHSEMGRIPAGRRPVEGGYEEHGGKLYHALGTVNGLQVPGKVGEHLSEAKVAFGGAEVDARDYYILCWRY
ncbi:hypothetical protein K474DRAFT_1684074 [Panus rudis PR-1116 ss-1]|nr:hypothetical protein K474DRAFT_1684074 [Panus rudis PR-1116 ss-1]